MRCCFLSAALLATSFPVSAFAVDLAKQRGPILKQPVCKSGKPGYALVVFGKNAERKLWLVLDGNTLYADLNGNGDLTDAGEAFTAGTSTSFKFPVPALSKSGPATAALYLQQDYRDRSKWRMRLIRGNVYQFAGYGAMPSVAFSSAPQSAPVLHFDGPLTLGRYSTPVTVPRHPPNFVRAGSLRLVVGTPGIGVGTFVSYHCRCTQKLGPLSGEFTYRDAGGKPIRVKHELKQSG